MKDAHRCTPLQVILRDDAAIQRAMQATGASRSTIWRYRTGASFPERRFAELLIAEFADHELDWNGCYEAQAE